MGIKIFAENKTAGFDVEILEKYQAGLVLNGQEVKSIRLGKMGLKGSYVVFKGNELFLVGANIPPYQPKNAPKDYNPERSRKLLLQKDEISRLMGKSKEKGLTLLPLIVYTNATKLKLEFGVAKRLKKFDKREKIKKADIKREIDRTLKGNPWG
jgi:SsrA-binding protein